MARRKRTAVPAPAKPDWGQLGPAMRALPNDQWRTFCHELVTGKPGHGRYARAARAAGRDAAAAPVRAFVERHGIADLRLERR